MCLKMPWDTLGQYLSKPFYSKGAQNQKPTFGDSTSAVWSAGQSNYWPLGRNIFWFQDSGWLRAARADRNYISIYARDNPGREDITESIVPWYALRCRADRLSQNDLRTICSAIPNRIAYLDRLFGTNCNNMWKLETIQNNFPLSYTYTANCKKLLNE